MNNNTFLRFISATITASIVIAPAMTLAQGQTKPAPGVRTYQSSKPTKPGDSSEKADAESVITPQNANAKDSTKSQQVDRTTYDLERVGVDNSKQLSLSLQQAIAMALGKNRDIEIERASIQMAEQDLLSARGA